MKRFHAIAVCHATGERVHVGDISASSKQQAASRIRRARCWIVSNLANNCAFKADSIKLTT